ncbi:MAG: Ldh family oxidoreductase, partial [Phycisphaerales bacterium]
PPDVGQVVLAIDPSVAMADTFLDRLEHEFRTLADEPGVRLPGDRRRATRARTEAEGVDVPDDLMATLRSYAAHGSPARP